MPGFVTIVTEDIPSEVAAERLLKHVDPEAEIANRLGRTGVGYIRGKLRGFNQAAAGMRILVLADRDSAANCPATMIQDWIGGPRHPNLVVRFAEMEVESWVLADQERIAQFLEVLPNRVPTDPDALADPKQALVNLARSSQSRRVRDDMCPPPGATSLVGPAYNDRLQVFLRERWRPNIAARHSPSLRRALPRVAELAQRA